MFEPKSALRPFGTAADNERNTAIVPGRAGALIDWGVGAIAGISL
jgi:hypothetical protein